MRWRPVDLGTMRVQTNGITTEEIKMPAYIERYMGNANIKPWWVGLPDTVNIPQEFCEGGAAIEHVKAKIFNYTVDKRQAFVDLGGYGDPCAEELKRIPGQFGLVCSDGFVIPTSVGNDYTVIQPATSLDVLEAVCNVDDLRIDTVGVLQERRRIWALIDLQARGIQIGPDRIKPNLLVTDSFDGSTRFIGKLVTTTVVCANTLACADAENGGVLWKIKHTANAKDKIAAAIEGVRHANAAFRDQADMLNELNRKPMTRSEYINFTMTWLTDSEDFEEAKVKVSAMAKAKREGRPRSFNMLTSKGYELVKLWDSGQGAEERQDTAYKAISAVTEYIDWQRGRMSNYTRTATRLGIQGADSAMFGEGAKAKARAVKLLKRA